MKVVAIVSGGMDSAVLAHLYRNMGATLTLVSFDYGQRHRRELDCAAHIAKALEARHEIINITGIRPLMKGSSLTDDGVPVPHGHYAEESMRLTVVPNRNAIMLSIAWGFASTVDAEILACGVHAGDHHIYPDCRPGFIKALSDALREGTVGHRTDGLHIEAPFVHKTKTDIARKGAELGVDFANTWTCYEGGEFHCGKCGSCTERREAFKDSGVPDPTVYFGAVPA